MVTHSPAAKVAAITIFVPGLLREYSGGRAQLQASARDVRSALEWLEANHPALHRNVCHETGAVRRHINLFVNMDNIRDLDGLATRLSSGDELIILPAVSGG
jgi:molybdopterin synthase sulfur carrier subunit